LQADAVSFLPLEIRFFADQVMKDCFMRLNANLQDTTGAILYYHFYISVYESSRLQTMEEVFEKLSLTITRQTNEVASVRTMRRHYTLGQKIARIIEKFDLRLLYANGLPWSQIYKLSNAKIRSLRAQITQFMN
jgi:hypothetical protein